MIYLYFATVTTVSSVMISIFTKIQSLSNLSGNVPVSQCPTFPTHSAHAPADTTTLVSSNQTNCPQTASYNLGTNLPKMSLQFSCHISMLCALCYNAPSLKSLLELISMNQIRKSEVWRIHGNKWWTWKDPYLMFEYKSNFNWCSIKNLRQNVDWLII